MEPNVITRLVLFIKTSYSKYLKESLSGLFMGGFGGYSIYFGNVPHELIQTWIGLWLWVKTIFFAFSSSIATAYGAYLIEKHKKKNNERKGPRRRQKDKAA